MDEMSVCSSGTKHPIQNHTKIYQKRMVEKNRDLHILPMFSLCAEKSRQS